MERKGAAWTSGMAQRRLEMFVEKFEREEEEAEIVKVAREREGGGLGRATR